MDKINIPLTTAITIATVLLSVGGSWAILKSKADDVDKIKIQAESNEKRIIKVEVNLDNIDESLKEQKANTKEIQTDIKEVLKVLRDR